MDLYVDKEDKELFEYIEDSEHIYNLVTENTDLSTKIEYESSEDVKRKIEKEVLLFLESIFQNNDPIFEMVSRQNRNTYYDAKEQLMRLGTLKSKRNLYDGLTYVRTWKLLESSYLLVSSHKTVNQREIYYMNKDIFNNQQECDDIIQDVVSMLLVPRLSLGITSSSKGSVAGLLEIYRGDHWEDISIGEGISITPELLLCSRIRSRAKVILVIEKDGIFRRLVEDKVYQSFPLILVTGRGFPDLLTKAFVRHIYTLLHIPILGLCDYNPFGISLLLTYMIGAQRSGLESYRYCVPIEWIGLTSEDIYILQPTKEIQQILTKRDLRKIDLLLLHPYIQQHSLFQKELIYMKNNGYKMELESLYMYGLQYISEIYIPKKIKPYL
ncbi:hypothetical protein WA158_005932 [Blastocystis sp. Blastoise]